MDAEIQVYRALQRHLDRMPSGFPEVESGLDIKLLKRFFTPEEAEIAVQLSMRPEPLKRVYQRVKDSGMSMEGLRQALDGMMRKGAILTFEEDYDETHYCNAEFTAGGIYNFQINRLTRELLDDYRQYQSERHAQARRGNGGGLPLRTVPVEKSIPVPEKYQVGDYDNVRKLVENAGGKIAVANCICRLATEVQGGKCEKTDLLEACLITGPDHARRHVDMGIGRYITKEEAFEILDKAQKAGLVLQPENSQRPDAICCCCGDCCVLLKMLERYPRPVDMYVTNFYAEVDQEWCLGCNVCAGKCQLNAITVNGKARVNLDRCIGCGNCVALCPQGAITLVKKETEKVPVKDKDTYNMKALSGRVGWWNMLNIRIKMRLGMKV